MKIKLKDILKVIPLLPAVFKSLRQAKLTETFAGSIEVSILRPILDKFKHGEEVLVKVVFIPKKDTITLCFHGKKFIYPITLSKQE